MFETMDVLIKDDWLGGMDELPGNIYSIAALRIGELCTPTLSPASLARRLGFLMVFVIQLIGPVMIFWQLTTNRGVDYADRIQWDKFHLEFPYSSDWASEQCATKLMSFLFVSVFCLNGAFCQIDDMNAWLKVDKIFRILEHNGSMRGTSENLLKLGAFMNCWVILWLELDVFIALGNADTVQDVLMDALGLTFIFNLDDIAGDLGFVDKDDWPGVQLAWVNQNIHEYAEKLSDVEEVEASVSCGYFLRFTGWVLGLLALVLPALTIFTPFYAMKVEPWYDDAPLEVFSNEAIKAIVQAAVANATGAPTA